MRNFIAEHQNQLISTLVLVFIVLVLKFVFSTATRKVGRMGEFDPVRTNLILKYISITLFTATVITLILIWGIDYKDLGVLLSSVFAVIGVALFAQWSILSNLTAGVILFFSFPFKIGNTIRILDNELLDKDNPNSERFVIEDIKAFHLHLRNNKGEILTYPNNLVLQKGVILICMYGDDKNTNVNSTV